MSTFFTDIYMLILLAVLTCKLTALREQHGSEIDNSSEQEVSMDSPSLKPRLICTFHSGNSLLHCGATACHASGDLPEGSYIMRKFPWRDRNNNVAYDLYRKIDEEDKFGRGYWHNHYQNGEVGCRRYFHVDVHPGTGENKLTIENSFCWTNVTSQLQRSETVELKACCYCPCLSGDILYGREVVWTELIITVL